MGTQLVSDRQDHHGCRKQSNTREAEYHYEKAISHGKLQMSRNAFQMSRWYKGKQSQCQSVIKTPASVNKDEWIEHVTDFRKTEV